MAMLRSEPSVGALATFILLLWLHMLAFFLIYIYLYLAVLDLSSGTGIWFPRQGWEFRPTVLGAWSLSNWTTREVCLFKIKKKIFFWFCHKTCWDLNSSVRDWTLAPVLDAWILTTGPPRKSWIPRFWSHSSLNVGNFGEGCWGQGLWNCVKYIIVCLTQWFWKTFGS